MYTVDLILSSESLFGTSSSLHHKLYPTITDIFMILLLRLLRERYTQLNVPYGLFELEYETSVQYKISKLNLANSALRLRDPINNTQHLST